VPPQLPYPFELVYISGFFEMGGIGLLIPFVSVAAAWGLIALFIAVFPANINMAINSIQSRAFLIIHSLLRAAFSSCLIAWAWCHHRNQRSSQS